MNGRTPPGPRMMHVVLLVWVLWALAGFLWTPFLPDAQAFRDQPRAGPSAAHWNSIRTTLTRCTGWRALPSRAAIARRPRR